MNEEKNPTQIAFNFGPVNGNVEKQEIHMTERPNPKQAEEADGCCSTTTDARSTEAAGQKTDTPEEENAEGLSIGQLLILFEAALDVTLDASYTNQSALAELISKVSGKKQSSVRQKICAGLDYDKPQTRRDAELVASLLDALKPSLAQKIRNNVNE